MSNRYKGGVISATPPTTTGGSSGVASGAWTLEQQLQLQAAGLWPSQPPPPNIEDVFSTYLYTGNGSTQTITNGIDLSTKGGLVWIKSRSQGTAGYEHILTDTLRGTSSQLNTASTAAVTTYTNALTAFNSTGFNLDSRTPVNASPETYVSWTFREQPKFFDIVTYTGDAVAGRTISHNLGSTPGCIIVKCTSASSTAWVVYHRSVGATAFLRLNTTGASTTSNAPWNDTSPTSTQFTVDGVGGDGGTNASGATYVAYLFAHDAGGFGLTGTDNVISCGSYTGNGSTTGPVVTLGYEPQWVMVKRSDSTGEWLMFDVMRSMSVTGSRYLEAQSAGAEGNIGGPSVVPTATGFQLAVDSEYTSLNASGSTYIYIAIRRGPMAVPTVGTSVFDPETATASTGTSRTIGFPADMSFAKGRTITSNSPINDRLRGYANSNTTAPSLFTPTTAAESTGTSAIVYNVWNTTALDGAFYDTFSTVWYHFRRAPSFFDVVCYTGTGSATTQTHNLGVVPEMMIVKCRSTGGTNRGWWTYVAPLGNTQALYLNGQDNAQTAGIWNNTTPTSTVFSIDGTSLVNGSGATYVAYLFATCAGVSKVGSYTGTGALQTINCGFTSGARFVLIKRTDSTGDWYVWDSARGIIPSNDPYFLINSSVAEVTGTDYVDTTNVGFDITSTAPAAINANGGTFIFLAIA